MEQTFFKSLFDLIEDKKVVKLTITKVGESLTILAVKDNKLITLSGTPEEVDDGILSHLKVTHVEKKELTVTVQDAPEKEDDDEEEEEESSEEKKDGKKSGKKSAAQGKLDKNKSGRKGAKSGTIKEQVVALLAEGKIEEAEVEVKRTNKAGGMPKDKVAELKKLVDDAKAALNTGETKPEEKTEDKKEQLAATSTETKTETKTEEKSDLKTTPASEKNLKALEDTKFNDLMAAGKLALEERKYDDAVNYYKEATDIRPTDENAKVELAKAEKWKKAVDSL